MLSYKLDFNSFAIRDGFRKSSHICDRVCKKQVLSAQNTPTVKPETLASGNFDKFGESESNRQT